jgi:putative endonuclease
VSKDKRRRAYRFGHWAEKLCVWWLRLGGYRVLARRYRTPVGEIDIVARRGATLAFIEVKARHETTRDDGGEVLTTRQRGRIIRAAEAFVARQRDLGHCAMRFDLMTVAPWRPPHHLKDAWRPG